MPNATIGQKTNIDKFSNFIELKQKDQKVQIRFINQDYYYDGKHFMKNPDGTWLVTNCPRINNELECQHCQKYFEIMKPMYELKNQMNAEQDETEKAKIKIKIEDIQKEARQFKPKMTFYYPVLDRDSGKAKILKTTLSVRLKLEELSEEDNVLEYDYLLKRTEKPGSDYYSLAAVDSKKTNEISEEEKVEIEKAKEWELEHIVGGKKSDLSLEKDDDLTAGLKVKDEEVIDEPKEENMSENVNPDDVPF